MKLNFSERIGLNKPKTELDKNKLSNELRNSLWTAMCTVVFETLSNEKKYNTYGDVESFSNLHKK
jgi:hypothetical protein